MAKQKRNAKVTKTKIIKNAMLLFSEKGFDATTVDDIAKASTINKAMIYYYYKNKSTLYENVMSTLFNTMYTEIKETEKCCDNVIGELKMFIETYAAYCEKNPYLPTLMLRELSNGGKNLPALMFSGMRDLFSLLTDILKKGEAEGYFKNVNPMIIHFMITGTLNLLTTTRTLREKAAALDSTLDTCSHCDMDEVAAYIFGKSLLLLDVSDEKNFTCVQR